MLYRWLVISILLLCLNPRPVLAHANLIRAEPAQRIARAGGHEAVAGVDPPTAGRDRPATSAPLDAIHARLLDCRTCAGGAVQKEAVEVVSRIDQQRFIERQARRSCPAGPDRGFPHETLRRSIVEQKRVLVIRLVRESAAAGFLPGELLIAQDRRDTRRRKRLGGERAGRPASQHRHPFHSLRSLPIGGCPGGRSPSRMGSCGAPMTPPSL